MATPGSSASKPPLKARDMLGNKSLNPGSLSSLTNTGVAGSTAKVNPQKDMLRRHKKSLVIIFLIKVQALGLPPLNHNFLRELVLEKTKEFKGIYGYFNKGHVELLRAYGDPEQLILDCQLDPQLLEQQQLELAIANENGYGGTNTTSRKTSVRASPYTKSIAKAPSS